MSLATIESLLALLMTPGIVAAGPPRGGGDDAAGAGRGTGTSAAGGHAMCLAPW